MAAQQEARDRLLEWSAREKQSKELATRIAEHVLSRGSLNLEYRGGNRGGDLLMLQQQEEQPEVLFAHVSPPPDLPVHSLPESYAIFGPPGIYINRTPITIMSLAGEISGFLRLNEGGTLLTTEVPINITYQSQEGGKNEAHIRWTAKGTPFIENEDLPELADQGTQY